MRPSHPLDKFTYEHVIWTRASTVTYINIYGWIWYNKKTVLRQSRRKESA